MSDQVLESKVQDLVEQVAQLPLLDQIVLVERVMARMKNAIPSETPRKTFRGLLSDLGTAPSAEEIDEVRREVWQSTPLKSL